MSFVVTWILLAVLWLGLSGHFDVVHLVFGFLSVTLVSAISHRHTTGGGPLGVGVMRMLRLAIYVPWLLWEIVVANVDVMLRVLGFREIEPCVVRFDPELESDFGRVTLANSITLTPGTVTVRIKEGEFLVHAISQAAADEVLTGRMARKVRQVEGGG